MTPAPVTLAELRTIDLFDDLEDDELAEWAAVAVPREVEAGGVVAESGEEVEKMTLMFEGLAQGMMLDGGRYEPVGKQQSPTWIGAIAVLTGSGLGVRIQAKTFCRVADVAAADFRRLAFEQPSIHRRVMQAIQPVMTRISSIEQSRERLASLGTMAAGLAHELNNPAAAARRAAAQLTEALDVIGSAMAHFVEAGVERSEAEGLIALQREAVARSASAQALDTVDAADAEDALLDRLEEQGVEEAWQLAEPLAAAGLDEDWLDRVAVLAGPATPIALRWVAATLTAGRLAAELEQSTERMTDLVGAVKSYAYMDRGGVVEVDVHEGLDTTLAVLKHKLKHTQVKVKRDYDRDLPKLTVRGSELNQVWTNLIDNAIDALGEEGTLTIATRAEGGAVVVEVTDDGPGVSEEIADRIFDPFFTTKDVGRGTGLGLATARSIVVDRHDGSLTLDSQPGRTTFRVRLPLRSPARATIKV